MSITQKNRITTTVFLLLFTMWLETVMSDSLTNNWNIRIGKITGKCRVQWLVSSESHFSNFQTVWFILDSWQSYVGKPLCCIPTCTCIHVGKQYCFEDIGGIRINSCRCRFWLSITLQKTCFLIRTRKRLCICHLNAFRLCWENQFTGSKSGQYKLSEF